MLSCCYIAVVVVLSGFFFFQAEDGIRDLVRSRGLGDVYKRQQYCYAICLGRGALAIRTARGRATRIRTAGRTVPDLSLIHI